MSALSDLRQIEADGLAPIAHTHYALCLTAAIRSGLHGAAQCQPIQTIGDGVYQITVTIAGRDHLVTVEPVPVRAEQVAA